MVTRRRFARGMTLVEVMVAMAVGTIGLLGTMAMVGALNSGATFSRDLTAASLLAQSKIEELNARTGITLASPPNGPAPIETTLDALGNFSPTGIYSRSVVWGVTADGLRRRVDATVSWNDGRGVPHSVSVSGERIP